jgi:RNA polymerase sigma-70 factor (ECF subfamily)
MTSGPFGVTLAPTSPAAVRLASAPVVDLAAGAATPSFARVVDGDDADIVGADTPEQAARAAPPNTASEITARTVRWCALIVIGSSVGGTFDRGFVCSDARKRLRVPRNPGGLRLAIGLDGTTDDPALLASAATGDREALGRLLTAQYDRCYTVCRRILTSEEDARDAAQEAMIAIARGLAGFDGRSSFSTWCYRVATNAALDELRRRRRRPVPASDRFEESEEGAPQPPAAGRDPVAGAVTDRLTVERALGKLPEDQRVAVVLRDIADLDYAEIGEVLGLPIGTVRSRIFRGRAALAEELRERGRPAVVTTPQRDETGPASVGSDEPPP